LLSENPGMNAKPGHRVVRTEDHAYVEWDGGYREVYDMNPDPYQLDGTVSSEEEGLVRHLDALKDCAANSCRAAAGS
jgi:hypothetical protein